MVISVFNIISYVLLLLETLVGMTANGFIVLVNYIDWFRSKKLSPNELILTCLSLSRLLWLSFATLNGRLPFFSVGTHHCHYKYVWFPIMWIFTDTTLAWFATWLSVFYLAKIAMFSHPFFLHLKLRFPGLLPWVLLGSVVFSAITAIIAVSSLTNGFSMCDSNKPHLNISDPEIKVPDIYMYKDLLLNGPNLIPLMVFLASSVLLMTSLWMHTRRMQGKGMGSKDLNTQAHWRAIKALASFAALYLCNFLAVTAQAVLIGNNRTDTLLFMLLSNIAFSSPTGHAIILILINPKLKQPWVRMLLLLKCCSGEMPS